MIYPVAEASFEQLMKLSLRYAGRTLKQIFLLIIAWVALKSFDTHLRALPSLIETLLGLSITLAMLFLFVMALHRADGVLREALLTWQQTWQQMQKNLLKVYLGYVLIIGGLCLIFFLGRWFIFSFMGQKGLSAIGTAMLLIGIPLILALIYSYLAIPLLALTERSIGKAFYASALYTKEHFGWMVVIYIEMVVTFFVSSNQTRHAQWLLTHHLMELVDLLILGIMAPLIINQTLLFLHDLQTTENSSHT